MTEPLVDVRCPDCHKLIFRAAGKFDVEVMCSGQGCKDKAQALGGDEGRRFRIKRLTYPVLKVKQNG